MIPRKIVGPKFLHHPKKNIINYKVHITLHNDTKMKSQEAAFKASRKPAPKPKITQPRNTATPARVTKNAARNERRKAARKTASLMKAQKGTAVGEGGAEEESKEGERAEVQEDMEE